MNLSDLQKKLPWTVPYSDRFKASTSRYKDLEHAVIHQMKSLGKIAAAIEKADHFNLATEFTDIDDQIADMAIAAIRMANVRPGGGFDLEAAVIRRLEEKNGVKL